MLILGIALVALGVFEVLNRYGWDAVKAFVLDKFNKRDS